MVYFPFLFTNRLYCTKNISIVHAYVYKNALNWQTLAYIFFLLWKVVKSFTKIALRKLTAENDTHAYIIIRQNIGMSVIAYTYHSLYGFACMRLSSISTIAVYTTLNLGFYISFIVLISFVVSVCLFLGGFFWVWFVFCFFGFCFLILNFINSKRQCNHAIKIHGHISRRVVKIDQYMTLNKLHKLQR